MRREGSYGSMEGVQLYASDTASDVKGDYINGLRRGETNEEATKKILDESLSKPDFPDPEEDAEVWFALADTRWKYGRLLPHVKENALAYLERGDYMERWKKRGKKNIRQGLRCWRN